MAQNGLELGSVYCRLSLDFGGADRPSGNGMKCWQYMKMVDPHWIGKGHFPSSFKFARTQILDQLQQPTSVNTCSQLTN
jgi:hypothetical protein